MNPTPKTIQIFLPGGDPRGIRVAEITTRILQVIEVPRSLLSTFLQMPESQQVALYFLVGGSDDTDAPEVYIGQTGDLKERLKKHNKDKGFWGRALIVVSRTASLTQTHTLFLEHHCIEAVRKAGRYTDQNGNSGSSPHVPPPLKADCLEIFDTASTLLATLGYPMFMPLLSSDDDTTEKNEVFYCQGSEADGRGSYTTDGFVVFEGSTGRVLNVPSFEKFSLVKWREELLASGVLQEKEGRLIFLKNHLFTSPSRAAAVIMGRSASGWTEWKNEAGKTLDELKRQEVNS